VLALLSITEEDPCDVCTDPQRNGALICVVAEAKDVFAIERTSAYDGRYHVLGGLISPMDGIGPSQLRVRELVDRVAAESPAEILVATNPNAEGEATALYLSRLLAPSGVNVTRLAYGLPIGGDLDYADENTLARAIQGRRMTTTFAATYLTLLSIIQGTTVALLFSTVQGLLGHGEFHAPQLVLTIGLFLIIVLLWHQYQIGVIVYEWVPQIVDAVIPICPGRL
jgi:recombination protein RecR